MAVVVDCGDFVASLVVADHLDFTHIGHHQGCNLPWCLHKRLAVASELDNADWVDHPDHCSSLSNEDDPIAAVFPVSVKSPEDGYVLGVNLREDGEDPRF